MQHITRAEIQENIHSELWQALRIGLKGKPLEFKIRMLNSWYRANGRSKESKIQIINYVNALKRSSYSKDIKKYL